MPVYDITHASTYRYAQPVARSHHVLHLEPLTHDTQQCLRFALEVSPTPLETATRQDYFGNHTNYFTITDPYQELWVTARSQAAVAPAPELKSAVTVGEARAWLKHSVEPAALQAQQFLYASPLAPALPPVVELARQLFQDDKPLIEAASELRSEIHQRFAYDPAATHAGTTMEDFLKIKRGVCQDFAHLAVATLRAAGLPGRYVSGYLLTRPLPGQPRLLGADASHAWVSTWLPDAGWLDFDPTNDLLCGVGHITTARGRDYGDVSPVRGTVVGGGPQALFLGVTVTPVGEPVA